MKYILGNNATLSFILIIMACCSNCKKEYPDNIPEWVKETIKEYKRGKKNGCDKQITERKNGNNEVLYVITQSGSEASFTSYFYDLSGNEMCTTTYHGFHFGGMDTCTVIPTSTYKIVRQLWPDGKSGPCTYR